METVSPTRMNLLLKKEEIKHVTVGIELLHNKREVLLREFFSTAGQLLNLRKQLQAATGEALSSLVLSLGFEGREKLLSYSLLPEKDLLVELQEKNLWGVRAPELKREVSFEKTEFGEIGASAYIDCAQENFEKLLHQSLRTLTEEIKLKRLGREIKSTSRKVNYLEKYILPVVHTQIKNIREVIDEREREDIFRLKRIKKKK